MNDVPSKCPHCNGVAAVPDTAVEAFARREAVAKAIYETQERLRADDDIPGRPWVPWEHQTSRREQRIALAMADAALEALAARASVCPGCEALGKECSRLEADREYNAELVRERDARIAELEARLEAQTPTEAVHCPACGNETLVDECPGVEAPEA